MGVGKTTVAGAVAELLRGADIAHALIDLDWLRECFPAPTHDPFHTAVGYENLASVATAYRRHGAQRLILVDVVESHATLDAYRAAIPGAVVALVRLKAEVATLHQRLRQRESGDALRWHEARAVELSAQMQRDALEDTLVETQGRTPQAMAAEILAWWENNFGD